MICLFQFLVADAGWQFWDRLPFESDDVQWWWDYFVHLLRNAEAFLLSLSTPLMSNCPVSRINSVVFAYCDATWSAVQLREVLHSHLLSISLGWCLPPFRFICVTLWTSDPTIADLIIRVHDDICSTGHRNILEPNVDISSIRKYSLFSSSFILELRNEMSIECGLQS